MQWISPRHAAALTADARYVCGLENADRPEIRRFDFQFCGEIRISEW